MPPGQLQPGRAARPRGGRHAGDGQGPRPALPGRGLLHLRAAARDGRRPTGRAVAGDPVAALQAADRRTWRRARPPPWSSSRSPARAWARGSCCAPTRSPSRTWSGGAGTRAPRSSRTAASRCASSTVQSAACRATGSSNQDPRAGREADEGTTVTLTVSGGPGEAPVPSVVGQTRADAARLLRDAGFDVRTRRAFSDAVDRGLVIEASPPEGSVSSAARASPSSSHAGSSRSPCPSVVGALARAAERSLTDAGLLPSATERENHRAGRPGIVLAQDPAAGSPWPRARPSTSWWRPRRRTSRCPT